jgi:hypothetical protein
LLEHLEPSYTKILLCITFQMCWNKPVQVCLYK